MSEHTGRDGTDGPGPGDPPPTDAGSSAQQPRPAHTKPALLLTVALGGMIGTGARAWLEQRFAAAPTGFPWTTFGINVVGAFTLATVLTALRTAVEPSATRTVLRLGLGTGMLGGFTTYSTLALETLNRLDPNTHAPPWLAMAYLGASVLTGVIAAAGGIGVGTLIARRWPHRTATPAEPRQSSQSSAPSAPTRGSKP